MEKDKEALVQCSKAVAETDKRWLESSCRLCPHRKPKGIRVIGTLIRACGSHYDARWKRRK